MRERWFWKSGFFDFEVERDDADGLDGLAGLHAGLELPFVHGVDRRFVEVWVTGGLFDSGGNNTARIVNGASDEDFATDAFFEEG
jgi:hypothetical protein